MKYAIWGAVSTSAQAKEDKVSLDEQQKPPPKMTYDNGDYGKPLFLIQMLSSYCIITVQVFAGPAGSQCGKVTPCIVSGRDILAASPRSRKGKRGGLFL